MMRIVITAIIIGPLFGCYMGISGCVIDAETNQPVEKAVVLVEWLETHGFGLTSHSVYKIEETETNREGGFSLPGAYNPMVDPPFLIIYRQGYVAWRNDSIFPSQERRGDYNVWQHGYVYKLNPFKNGMSREQHSRFMQTGIIGSSLEKTPKYEAAYGYELEAGLKERNRERQYFFNEE